EKGAEKWVQGSVEDNARAQPGRSFRPRLLQVRSAPNQDAGNEAEGQEREGDRMDRGRQPIRAFSRVGGRRQHVFFLHSPSFFNSSQVPLICSRCDLTAKPRRWLIWLSSFSIRLLSNSTILSQSWQMMW